MLAPEDVAKLQMNNAPIGCLILMLALLLIGGIVVGIFLNSIIWVAGYALIAVAIFVGYYLFRKKKNGLIDQDILNGRKNVIIAPIESKRIDSSETLVAGDKGRSHPNTT